MAEQSDKWHHSLTRYLGLSPDTSFSFGIQPGFCRESVGRYDMIYTMADCFNSKQNYLWSEFHYRKAIKTKRLKFYYGTCPFMWDLGKVATSQSFNEEGSLFFLPRDDQATIRDSEIESVQDWIDWAPRPITFLLPWRTCDIWSPWEKLKLPKESEIIQLNDRNTRQFTLASLLLKHEHIYIPWPGTDIFYAEFLNKNIHIYDDLKLYRNKTPQEMERLVRILEHLKWGWDSLNEKQKKFFTMLRDWNNLPKDDRKFLTQKMLGLDVLKSPENLYHDMQQKGFLPEGDFISSDDYQTAYEWLREKTIKFANIKCSERCSVMYDTI